MPLEFALHGARLFDRHALKGEMRRAGFGALKAVPAGGGFWFVVGMRGTGGP
jgi:hypothetical protein